jgi:uncharacterized protein (TIGR00304 family)
MRRLTAAALALFVLGIVLLAQSSSVWALAGMALIFAAIFLFFFSMATPMREATTQPSAAAPQATVPQQPAKKFGGIVFVGPIPIVFGSDKKVAKWMLVVALVIVILLIIAMWYFATQLPR